MAVGLLRRNEIEPAFFLAQFWLQNMLFMPISRAFQKKVFDCFNNYNLGSVGIRVFQINGPGFGLSKT